MYKLTQKILEKFKVEFKEWWGEEDTQYQADICDFLYKNYLSYIDYFVRQAILDTADSLKNGNDETEKFEIDDVLTLFDKKFDILLKNDEKLDSLADKIKVNSKPAKALLTQLDTRNIQNWTPDTICQIVCGLTDMIIKKTAEDILTQNDWEIFFGLISELQMKSSRYLRTNIFLGYIMQQIVLVKHVNAINSKQSLILNIMRCFSTSSIENDTIYLKYFINFNLMIDLIFEINYYNCDNIDLLNCYKKVRDKITTLEEATFVKAVVNSDFINQEEYENIVNSFSSYLEKKPDVARCIKTWLPNYTLIQNFKKAFDSHTFETKGYMEVRIK